MARDAGTGDLADRFSLMGGGPFDALLDRFGLIGEDQLPTWRAAVVMALLAWMLPAALAVMQALFDSRYAGWGYFTDGTVYARYLVAVWAMLATERYGGARLTRLLRHFRDPRR